MVMEIQHKNKVIGRATQGREETITTTINTKQQLQSIEEGVQNTKKQQDAASPSPSPSATSSPSHEFSFTISLHNSSSTAEPDNTKPHQPPIAIDLTPADEIFFHGHLLPLHLLSNLPVSPRSSTNSLDSFTLPIRELLGEEDKHHSIDSCICINCDKTKRHSFNSYEFSTRRNQDNGNRNEEELPKKERVKSKSFSLFGLARRRKDQGDSKAGGSEDQGDKQKKKLKYDVSHFLKKYIRMFSKGSSRDGIELRKQPYSFSGKLSPREGKRNLRGRRGEFSAPASMRTSPTNSGILKLASKPPTSDSTMEELQAAIQAAIAHCKNSVAKADRLSN